MRMSGLVYLFRQHLRHTQGVTQRFMKTFWLDLEGNLVCVDVIQEDIKLSRLRAQRLEMALSCWTKDPSLCSHTIKASDEAHRGLFAICGQATRVSGGRFHNLYAHYPLPVDADIIWISDRVIQDPPDVGRVEKRHELRDRIELLFALEPFYVAYFKFLSEPDRHEDLKRSMNLLGAEWLRNVLTHEPTRVTSGGGGGGGGSHSDTDSRDIGYVICTIVGNPSGHYVFVRKAPAQKHEFILFVHRVDSTVQYEIRLNIEFTECITMTLEGKLKRYGSVSDLLSLCKESCMDYNTAGSIDSDEDLYTKGPRAMGEKCDHVDTMKDMTKSLEQIKVSHDRGRAGLLQTP
ncbi:hypothetical protein XENOCAPTIV_030747 [Xenoophorus captivus]|uniref:Uncharacterized protein n=1 Tax=Xenoophorus captivus TaxID=1517983 RepID=A0ABV0S4F0_9TELE